MNFSLKLQCVAHHEVLDHPGNCLRFIYCANSGKLQFSNNFSILAVIYELDSMASNCIMRTEIDSSLLRTQLTIYPYVNSRWRAQH